MPTGTNRRDRIGWLRAAVLRDDRMIGQSHSLGRDFLLVWRARRRE